MEEAVTRKFVHQDSSSVTSLCGMLGHMFIHFIIVLVSDMEANN